MAARAAPARPILAARIAERDEAIGAQVSDLPTRGAALASRIGEHGSGVERLNAEVAALADRSGRLEANLAVRLGQPHSRGAALRSIGVSVAAHLGRLARRIYRPFMLFAIRFVTARPALRRQAERALSRVPGLAAYLRRFAAPPPAGVSDPNAPYLFRPGEAPVGEQGQVTVEHLYHMSRSL